MHRSKPHGPAGCTKSCRGPLGSTRSRPCSCVALAFIRTRRSLRGTVATFSSRCAPSARETQLAGRVTLRITRPAACAHAPLPHSNAATTIFCFAGMAVDDLKCTHFSRSARRRPGSVQPASSSHDRSWRALAKSRSRHCSAASLLACFSAGVFLFFLFLSSFPFNIFFFSLTLGAGTQATASTGDRATAVPRKGRGGVVVWGAGGAARKRA